MRMVVIQCPVSITIDYKKKLHIHQDITKEN